MDPDGIIKFKIGVSANAGAGVGGNLESGFVIGFSKERKITIVVYTSESLGSEFGATAFFGLVIGIDLASDEVKTENTTSMTIGGSADGGLGIGLDLSMDTDTKEIDLSLSKGFSFKAGIGVSELPREVHMTFTSTQTKEIEIDNSAEVNERIMNRYYEHH